MVEELWHTLDTRRVLTILETGLEGLSEDDARRRFDRYGPNELAISSQTHPFSVFLRQLKSPLIYLFLVAALITFLIGDYVDTGVILVVITLNTLLGFVQEYKAEQSLSALAQISVSKARVLRDGMEREIDASRLVPGDVVLLEEGMRVPADIRLFRAFELQADEAILTDESLPATKTAAEIPDPDAPIADRSNMVFMGASIMRGRGAGIVVSTGPRTEFGQLSTQVRQLGEVESPLQKRLERLTRQVSLFVLVITPLIFLLGVISGESLADIFLISVATAVAAVPEGLPVVITVALAVGVSRMAQRNAIVRKLPAVEALGSCTVICSDKTGTLTKDEMTVVSIYAGDRSYEVTGTGYLPEGQILFEGRSIVLSEHPELELALRIGMLCNESSLYQEDDRYLPDGDPTEVALIVSAMKGGLNEEREKRDYPLLDEIPFETDQQYMATLHDYRGGRVVFVKGAPERVVEMCDSTLLGEAIALSSIDRDSLLQESQTIAAQGLRVLAMAYKILAPGTSELDHSEVERGLTFVGIQGMIDPPRPEAIDAIANCERAGIRVIMVTGDHKVTAETVARETGITQGTTAQIVEGRELEELDDDELLELVGRVAVFARADQSHKLRIVQQLRRRGEVVAVTGNGVSDAPALKQADIGVAMGISGTDVARESADMVLADDNFATIYASVVEGRVIFDNVRKVIAFLIPINVGLVPIVIAGIAAQLPLPLLPAQVIWINLVAGGLQDIGIAFEPAEEDVGRRPPRNPREGLLTRQMIERMAVASSILLAGTLGMFVWQLRSGATLEYARTAAMTTMVLFQTFYLLNSRSLSRPALGMSPLSNRLLLASIALALGLHIIALYWPPLQMVLRIEPLNMDTWLVMVAMGTSLFAAVEVHKALHQRGIDN